jgi:uncharacterized protein YjiS (DUF1127 family)
MSTTMTGLKHQFTEWRRQMRSRQELTNLSDRCLRDIGVIPGQLEVNVSKPYWMS